jgi:hypothetical protein
MTGTGAELFTGLEGRAEGLSVADRDGLSDARPAAMA